MPFIIFILLEVLDNLTYDFDLWGQLTLLQLLVAFWCGYYVSNKPTILRKSTLLTCIIYMVYINIVDFFFISFDYVNILEVIIFSYILSFQLHKTYNISSDKLNHDNVCLILYKPKRGINHIIISMFGFPVSSFGVVCGKWGRFIKETDKLVHQSPDKITGNYIIIDTGVKITPEIQAEFDKTLGASAYNCCGIRIMCVKTFKNVLSLLGKKWRYRLFDFLPSVYLGRRV